MGGRRDWAETGSSLVLSGADFVLGVNKAFSKLGARFKRGKFEDFIETLCAIIGDVAKQNGELLREERDTFRQFIIDKRDFPAFALFEPDELVQKMQSYAIASFLGDNNKITLAIKNIEPGGLPAKLLIIAALYVAGADGDIDSNELSRIKYYAEKFQIDLNELASECNIQLASSGQQIEARQPDSVCPMCDGKGCMMCE